MRASVCNAIHSASTASKGLMVLARLKQAGAAARQFDSRACGQCPEWLRTSGKTIHSSHCFAAIAPDLTITSHTFLWLLAMSCVSASAATQDAGMPCQPRNLAFDSKDAGWSPVPLSRLKRDTAYSVAQEEGRAVLRATADRSASLYVARLQPALRSPMTISWEWMTDALVPGADNRKRSAEDAPLRVLVAFDGDPGTLPEAERKRFSRAKNLARRELPYAVLMYIWTDHVPVGAVIPSAHTSQVKMMAVASGPNGLGRWQSVQRDIAADYRKAYGTEPGPVLGVAVMTDTDNTGTQAAGSYAGIRLSCGSP